MQGDKDLDDQDAIQNHFESGILDDSEFPLGQLFKQAMASTAQIDRDRQQRKIKLDAKKEQVKKQTENFKIYAKERKAKEMLQNLKSA